MASYHTRLMMAMDDYLAYMKLESHYNTRNNLQDIIDEKVKRLEKIRAELDYIF